MHRAILLAVTSAIVVSPSIFGVTVLAGCSRGGPTATLPATPAAPGSSPITDTPVAAKIGEVFDFGGLEVKVVEVVDPLSSTESSYIPLPGNRFVGVNFELANPGGQPRTFSPALEANLVDQEGGRYQILLGQRAGDLAGQEVAPGADVNGRVAFELADARRPVLLELRRDGVRGVDVELA